MRIVKVEKNDNTENIKLANLLDMYFIETNKDDYIGNTQKCYDATIMMHNNNRGIYLLYNDIDEAIGFLIAYIDNQYNVLKSYVACEYMYIIPSNRSSTASMWLFTMLGKICVEYGYPAIGTTYVHSSNLHNNRLIGGEDVAVVFKFPLDVVAKKYNKYMKRINNEIEKK